MTRLRYSLSQLTFSEHPGEPLGEVAGDQRETEALP